MLKLLIISAATFFISGCATQFTETNIEKLRIGLSANEVKEMFGSPGKVSSSVCGSATPTGSWICEKWRYETWSGINEFTFAVRSEGKFLNSWIVNR
jgi:hypothetical protein